MAQVLRLTGAAPSLNLTVFPKVILFCSVESGFRWGPVP